MNHLDNQALFTEQRDYLRANKDAMFSEFKNDKIGFDLYLPMKISYYVLFTLRKKYTTIHEDIHTEKFVSDEFSDVLDALIVKEGDNFSLKASLKAEIKLNVITDYMMSISRKKVYPSEIRKKEISLNNAIVRARKVIDDYFKDDEMMYKDLFPIIDIYEVVVRNHGKHVDFHFGKHGFTLTSENTKALRLYLEEERVRYKEKLQLVADTEKEISEMIVRASFPTTFESWFKPHLSAYDMTSKSVEEIQATLEKQTQGLKQLHVFFTALQTAGHSLPKEMKAKDDYETIVLNDLYLSTALNPTEFFSHVKEYRLIQPFINSVVRVCRTHELKVDARVKNGVFFLKGRMRNSDVARTHEAAISLSYRFANGKMYRLTGEEIYTAEALIFEVFEHVRQAESRYIESVEKAKEMLLLTLSETEEQLLLEKDVTILEGEKNYYALVASEYYNNVVKIPKKLASMDEIKALCIHPADRSTPMYDGFASIALSVKSGDEQYVLDNSNEFKLSNQVKEKIKAALSAFEPLRHLQLA